MNLQSKLDDLRTAAAKLSIEIQYDDLCDHEFSIQSGHCKLNGRDMIILDKKLSDGEQIDVILNALRKFDLENVFIAPWIRERLETPPDDRRHSTLNPPEPS
ncbi:MAG: hypothetical protein ACE5G9_13110 [Nitrospinales bacterium]